MMPRILPLLLATILLCACGDDVTLGEDVGVSDAADSYDGNGRDAVVEDVGLRDSTPQRDTATLMDAQTLDTHTDARHADTGFEMADGAVIDGGPGAGSDAGFDAGFDAGAGLDAGSDAGPGMGFDAGPGAGSDAGFDAGSDAGSGGCVSGAVGTHALRFRWTGSTSGSRATVDYLLNNLPDPDWRVSAASRSISYRPVFRDPFLGEGGLEVSGSVFIDVELSTAMLAHVNTATLAIYGRSYNTTASGSFSWQSFSGIGATPSGFVSNVAPYRWYLAEVTDALPAGDSGTRFRIKAGGPSGALIVSRVELCFDAN